MTTVTVIHCSSRRVVRDSGGPLLLYVYRRVLNPDDLLRWADGVGLGDLEAPGDLHVTVAYSRTPVDWFKMRSHDYDLAVGPGGPRRLEVFGKPGDGVTVLRLADPTLQERWRYYRDQGCSWDWPDYAPHVTLAGDPGPVDVNKVEAFSGVVRLGPEVFAPVK